MTAESSTVVECSFEGTRADFNAMRRYVQRRGGLPQMVLMGIAGGAMGLAFAVALNAGAPVAAVCVVVSFLCTAAATWRVNSTNAAAITKTMTFRFDDRGVGHAEPGHSCHFDWARFRDVGETTTHFFLLVTAVQGFVVPKRAFASEADMTTVRRLMANGPSETAIQL